MNRQEETLNSGRNKNVQWYASSKSDRVQPKTKRDSSLLTPTANRFLSEELEKTAISALINLTIKIAEGIKEKMESKPASPKVDS